MELLAHQLVEDRVGRRLLALHRGRLGPLVRSRLVARGIAWGARHDVNAGTPPLAAVRLLLSLAACRARGGARSLRSIALDDAEVAFFHATLDEWICISKPPPGTAPPGQGWQLRQTLYSTRRAAQLWAECLFDRGMRI